MALLQTPVAGVDAQAQEVSVLLQLAATTQTLTTGVTNIIRQNDCTQAITAIKAIRQKILPKTDFHKSLCRRLTELVSVDSVTDHCDVIISQMQRTHRQDELTDVEVGGVGTTVVEGDHVGVYQITVFIRVDLIRRYCPAIECY